MSHFRSIYGPPPNFLHLGPELKLDNLALVKPNISIFSPNYTYVFRFENEFDYRKTAGWMKENWTASFYWTAAYLVFIFFGSIYMSTRPQPFRLKVPLALWNVLLASFSIAGTLRTWPELFHVLNQFGFHHSVCRNTFHKEVPTSSFWTWLFIISKAPELVDTVFVVLRKQKLIFLHWYHHASVLIFTWYCYADEASTGRWYSNMNYSVHAIMYTYYALRALGIRIPRQLAMSITISQIAQMIMGTYVTFYAFWAKTRADRPCDISMSTLYFGMAIYVSYFLLFAQFFIASYLRPARKTAAGSASGRDKATKAE